MIANTAQNSEPNLTTAFHMKQDICKHSNHFDNQEDSMQHASHIPVIKATNYLPSLANISCEDNSSAHGMPAPADKSPSKFVLLYTFINHSTWIESVRKFWGYFMYYVLCRPSLCGND